MKGVWLGSGHTDESSNPNTFVSQQTWKRWQVTAGPLPAPRSIRLDAEEFEEAEEDTTEETSHASLVFGIP